MVAPRTISPIIAALIVALGSPTAQGQARPSSYKAATEAACKLGAQVVREESSASPLVFEGVEEPGGYYPVHDAPLAGKIPPDLVAAADKVTPSNLFVDCPALAAELPEGGRMATAEDRAKLRGPTAKPLYITSIQTPILDPSGIIALVSVYHNCGGLCGNGGLYLYRYANGRWVRSEKLVSVLS
jgi:hypothetical protein